MKRPLTKILKNWLENNEGYHNKASLLRLEWHYENDFRTYSPDTVGRKLREATEDGMILSRTNDKGQTEYSAKKRPQFITDPITRTVREYI